MKSVLTTIIAILLIGFNTTAQPTPKIQEVFSRTFPQASDIQWQQKEHTYTGSFKEDSILYVLDFDSDGNLLSSVKRSDEKGLPVNLLYNFKRKHKGKEIVTVSQMINEEGTQYYITAQDENFIYWFKGNTYAEISLDQKLPK